MAVMDNSLLRDLFQNNIDFVAKQWGRILDAIYGEQATENSVLNDAPLIYHTTQYMGASGNEIKTGMIWNNQVGTYTVDFDDTGFHINGTGQVFITTDASTNSQIEILNSVVAPYLRSFSCGKSLSEMNVDHFFCNGDQIRCVMPNGSLNDFSFSAPFGVDTNYTLRYDNAVIYTNKQSYQLEDRDGYSFYDFNNLSFLIDPASWDGEIRLYSIGGDNPSNFVLIPTTDSTDTYNIVNDYSDTVNIEGDTVYNYYNDYGDIVINGGGIGGGGAVIAPVGGLAYADVKFILDSLIDDLNVRFNFGGNGGTPLEYAPTWEELHYIDQGSFYITPIEQIDSLPVAPDIADTVIDVSEPLGILSTGFGALLDSFNNIGVTLTLTFTFLSCLIINKLRGD